MYNGFEWYGRMLEVREVINLEVTLILQLTPCHRTATLV